MFIMRLRNPLIYGTSGRRPDHSEKGGECGGDLRRGTRKGCWWFREKNEKIKRRI